MKTLPFILILALIIFSCKKENPKSDPIADQKLSKISFSAVYTIDTTHYVVPVTQRFRFNYDDTGTLLSLDVNHNMIGAEVFQRINIYYRDSLIDYIIFEVVDTVVDYSYWNGVRIVYQENFRFCATENTYYAHYDGNGNFKCFTRLITPSAFTYIFNESGRLDEIRRTTTKFDKFTYDTDGNVTTYYGYGMSGVLSRFAMTYDGNPNPYYQFPLYVDLWLDFPPIPYFRPIMLSPNNVTTWKRDEHSTRTTDYIYGANGYPETSVHIYDIPIGHYEFTSYFEYEAYYNQ